MCVDVARLVKFEVVGSPLKGQLVVGPQPDAVHPVVVLAVVHHVVSFHPETYAPCADAHRVALQTQRAAFFLAKYRERLAAQHLTFFAQEIHLHVTDFGRRFIDYGQAKQQRIEGFTGGRVANLEVQVRTVRATRVAQLANFFPFFYPKLAVWRGEFYLKSLSFVLVFKHILLNIGCEAVQVRVQRGVAVGVLDVQHVAVSAGLHLDLVDEAIGSSKHGLARPASTAFDVDTRVKMAGPEFAESAAEPQGIVYRGHEIILRVVGRDSEGSLQFG